jgi:hypothetical protein
VKHHGVEMNILELAKYFGLNESADDASTASGDRGDSGGVEYGPASPPMYVDELRRFAEFLKTHPDTKEALAALASGGSGGDDDTAAPGGGGGGDGSGFETTGDLSNKCGAFKAQVHELLNEWKVGLRADNVYMDTIPAEQSEKQKEQIIKALEREWAAQGRPWSEGGASAAHPMSPTGSGDDRESAASGSSSSGGGSSSGLPARTPIPDVDETELSSVPRLNRGSKAPMAPRDTLHLQPPAPPRPPLATNPDEPASGGTDGGGVPMEVEETAEPEAPAAGIAAVGSTAAVGASNDARGCSSSVPPAPPAAGTAVRRCVFAACKSDTPEEGLRECPCGNGPHHHFCSIAAGCEDDPSLCARCIGAPAFTPPATESNEPAVPPPDGGGVPMEVEGAPGAAESCDNPDAETGLQTVTEGEDAENGSEQVTAPAAPVDDEEPIPMEPEEDCTICADPLGTKGGIQKLGCGHEFCRQCIATHLALARQKSEGGTCPLCRQVVSVDDTIACGPGQPPPVDPRPRSPAAQRHVGRPGAAREIGDAEMAAEEAAADAELYAEAAANAHPEDMDLGEEEEEDNDDDNASDANENGDLDDFVEEDESSDDSDDGSWEGSDDDNEDSEDPVEDDEVDPANIAHGRRVRARH